MNFLIYTRDSKVKEIIEYYAKKEGISISRATEKLVREGFSKYLLLDSEKEVQVTEKIVEVLKPKIVYKIVEHEYRQPKLDKRKEEVRKLRDEGWGIGKLAKKYGVCRRTIWRDLGTYLNKPRLRNIID